MTAPTEIRSALPPAAAAALVAIVGLSAIAGALIFEHGFGYVPCMLCLQQRWPYYLGVPLAVVALLLARRGVDGGAKLALVAVGIGFLAGAGLGLYHAGVEWRFWPGPTSCAGANAAPTGAGGLLEQMKATRIVPCDAAAWRFLGLSLAGYNAIISLALAGIAFAGVFRRR